MLCNNCIHKKVCKHVENFKEYEKQYEEMRKKSSLFDKPIECPCYETKKETRSELNEKINKIYKINNEIKKGIIKNKLFKLKANTNNIIKRLDYVSEVILHPNEIKKYKEFIRNSFDEIIDEVDKLKIN